MKNKVIKFINGFKEVQPEYIQFTFYRGYCYWFAFILAERFKGEIWFNPDIVHFATYIKSDYGNEEGLYDIYGLINIWQNSATGEDEYDNWMSWEEYQYRHQDAVESIVNSCIKKV